MIREAHSKFSAFAVYIGHFASPMSKNSLRADQEYVDNLVSLWSLLCTCTALARNLFASAMTTSLPTEILTSTQNAAGCEHNQPLQIKWVLFDAIALVIFISFPSLVEIPCQQRKGWKGKRGAGLGKNVPASHCSSPKLSLWNIHISHIVFSEFWDGCFFHVCPAFCYLLLFFKDDLPTTSLCSSL